MKPATSSTLIWSSRLRPKEQVDDHALHENRDRGELGERTLFRFRAPA
jgi:hypothetical protein